MVRSSYEDGPERVFFCLPITARQFAVLQFSFLGGVVLASLLPIPFWFGVAVSLCSVIFLVFVPGRWKIIIALLPLCVWCGVLRLQASEPPTDPYAFHQYTGSTVVFHGVIVEEVDKRLSSQRFIVKASNVESDGTLIQTSGRVLVRSELYPEYSYGDALRVSCALSRPEPMDDFAYDQYLALSGVFSVCSFAHVTKESSGQGNPVLGTLFRLKLWLLNRMNVLMAEPHSSLLAGLLIGARRGLPPNVLDAFQAVGLTHIIALSGFNITIIATAIFAAALSIGVHRKYVFWVVVVVLLAFVLLTGAPSSVVRASIMGMIVLLARYVGRVGHVWYALLFAATVMVLINPRVVVFDVGFQLSFLATIGLLVVSPRLERFFRWLPQAVGMREAATATLGASAMTAPLILLQFGRLSFISPVVNLLVLPAIPLAMLLGFLAVVIPFVGPLLAYLDWLVLSWILFVAEWFATRI